MFSCVGKEATGFASCVGEQVPFADRTNYQETRPKVSAHWWPCPHCLLLWVLSKSFVWMFLSFGTFLPKNYVNLRLHVLGKVIAHHLPFFHFVLPPAQAFGQGAAWPRGISLQPEGEGILWNRLHRWDVSAPCAWRTWRENTEPEVVASQLSTVKAAAGHLGLVVQGQSKFIIWISKALWSCLERPKDIIRVMLILWNYEVNQFL